MTCNTHIASEAHRLDDEADRELRLYRYAARVASKPEYLIPDDATEDMKYHHARSIELRDRAQALRESLNDNKAA